MAAGSPIPHSKLNIKINLLNKSIKHRIATAQSLSYIRSELVDHRESAEFRFFTLPGILLRVSLAIGGCPYKRETDLQLKFAWETDTFVENRIKMFKNKLFIEILKW